MSKKRTIIDSLGDAQHPNRVTIEENLDPKDQPTVMAYRLGSLENAVKEGFAEIKQRQDDIIKGFVTENEFMQAKSESAAEHARIWVAINSMKSSVKWWVGTAIATGGVLTGAILAIKALFK